MTAPRILQAVLPLRRASALRDALAGLALAAMNVPQALGYARIAGMPLFTGLYTLLLPLVAFATLGSSRYLVVAADSATAAILAGQLSRLAPVASERYVALAGLVALMTAALLLLARVFRLGFLSDFLSQTVLVGFLTGVGFQVGIAVLGGMLGLVAPHERTLGQLAQIAGSVGDVHLPTLTLSSAVVALVLALRRFAPRLPGPLFAVAGAIAASAAFDFAGHGIPVIGAVPSGLPRLALPDVGWSDAGAVLPIAGACFLMIVTQSAATARAYAARHRETLDEDADLVGLAAANALAAASGAFVVNGSPTQTAMVESSGARSQLAQVATAVVVALVLLLLTAPLRYLPHCVLGAIVFTIAVGLVDVRGLRHILRESPGEFHLALVTAAVVVAVGVEQGILLAMVLSLLRHVRHTYRPHTDVLVRNSGGLWQPIPATPGATSGPGLVVYRFGAGLFYANANRFAAEVRALVEAAPSPVRWLVIDAGAITSLDYTAGRTVRDLHADLVRAGVHLLLAHVEPHLRSDLDRHRLTPVLGAENLFDRLHDTLAAITERGAQQASSQPAPRALASRTEEPPTATG